MKEALKIKFWRPHLRLMLAAITYLFSIPQTSHNCPRYFSLIVYECYIYCNLLCVLEPWFVVSLHVLYNKQLSSPVGLFPYFRFDFSALHSIVPCLSCNLALWYMHFLHVPTVFTAHKFCCLTHLVLCLGSPLTCPGLNVIDLAAPWTLFSM